jgi:hypothetical protein
VHRVRLGYGGDHIARVPEHVARERDARLAAAADQDAISALLGEPPPGRSALAERQRRQAEREAAERIRPSISAAPPSRSISCQHSAQARQLVNAPAGRAEREPEPPPEPVPELVEPAPEAAPEPAVARIRKLPVPLSRACCHYQGAAPAACACFHSGASYWFAGELRRDPRCIIALLAQGYGEAEIAKRLAIKPRLIERLARIDGGMDTIPGLLNDRGGDAAY